MNVRIPLWLLLSLSAAFAQPAAFQIDASIKTVEKTKSDRQELPGGSTRLIQETKMLSIEVKRTNPTVGEHATVKWVLLQETMRGVIHPVALGQQRVRTPMGIPVEVEGGTFTLRERTFNGNANRSDGSLEQSVKGYGILVVDDEGNELASKFQPSGIEAESRKALEKSEEKVGGGDRPLPPRFRR